MSYLIFDVRRFSSEYIIRERMPNAMEHGEERYGLRHKTDRKLDIYIYITFL